MPRLLLWLSAVALIGCAPVRVPNRDAGACVTECGMLLLNSDKCKEFKHAEHNALVAFKSQLGWEPDAVCSRLFGYQVTNEAKFDGWFEPRMKIDVLGVTYCGAKDIHINCDDFAYSSLYHEMAHAFECELGMAEASHNHLGWKERGIYSAIKYAKNLP